MKIKPGDVLTRKDDSYVGIVRASNETSGYMEVLWFATVDGVSWTQEELTDIYQSYIKRGTYAHTRPK